LVCDIVNGKWHKWTQLSKYFPDNIDITAMSWANGVVTVIAPGHNVIDGSYTNISEVSPGAYDGDYVMTYLDENTFSYEKATNPGTYLNSGEVRTYFEVPFNMASYAKTGSFDVVQDSTTGVIYSVTTASYKDAGIPIRWMARTSNIDGGNNQLKFYSRLELIGDKVGGTAYLKYSDDDYQTWKKYRPVDLSNQRSQLYRLGSSRRRAYEIINYDDLPIRLHSIELSVDKGYT
jgi:hypothetical protein